MMRPDASTATPVSSECGSPKAGPVFLAGVDEELPLTQPDGWCCPQEKVSRGGCCRVVARWACFLVIFALGGAAASGLLYWKYGHIVQDQLRRSAHTVTQSSWDHDVGYCRKLLARESLHKAIEVGPARLLTNGTLQERLDTLSDVVKQAEAMQQDVARLADHDEGRLKAVEGQLAKAQAENGELKELNLKLGMQDAKLSHAQSARLLEMFSNEAMQAGEKNVRLETILGDITKAVSHSDCFAQVAPGWPAPREGHRDASNGGAALGLTGHASFSACLATCAAQPRCEAAIWNATANATCVFQTAKPEGHFEEVDGGAFTYVKKPSCTQTAASATADSHAAPQKRYAYVMMAYDDPEHSKPGDALLPVMAMAKALQHLSTYPLVLLTNTTSFVDGTPVAPTMRELGVEVLPLHQIQSPQHFEFRTWNVAWWKLQIWNLTQYEKLIWLDSDAIVTRSMDWLFERDGVWAQRDDWFCALNGENVCSGIMLLQPNRTLFEHIVLYAASGADLRKGDQGVLQTYFRDVLKQPMQLMSAVDASFGQCIGKAPSPFIDLDGEPVQGTWSVPAFVHKSGGWGNTNNNDYINVCFSHHIARQYYIIGNATVNMCHYHTLGAYWRNLFCDAVTQAGLRQPDIQAYCDDDCWYRGVEPPAIAANGTYGTDATNKLWCTPVDTAERIADYEARVAGEPLRELLLRNPRKLPKAFLK